MLRASFLSIIALLSTLQLGACAKSDTAAANDSAAAAEAAPAPNVTPATPVTETAATTEASMTVDDIDRWQRGMDAELTTVREAGVKFKNARNSNDSLSAMMQANETRTAGGRAAGVDQSRYGIIATTLSSIARYMVPIEQEMEVGKMPAEMITAMNNDRAQTFARMSPAYPPAVIEALRPRAAALRKQELTLVGERLKAAGMVR